LSFYHSDDSRSIAAGVYFGGGWIFTCSHNLGDAASNTTIFHRMNGKEEIIEPTNRISIYKLLPESTSGAEECDIASFSINYDDVLSKHLNITESHVLSNGPAKLHEPISFGVGYCVFVPKGLPNVHEIPGICIKVKLNENGDRFVQVVPEDQNSDWKFIKGHSGCPIFRLKDDLLVGFVFYSSGKLV
jgi:hypothetical protein